MLDLKMAMLAGAEILRISSSQPILKSAMHHALVIQLNFVVDRGVCKYMNLDSLGINMIILTKWMTCITNIQKLQQRLLSLRKRLLMLLANLTILAMVNETRKFRQQ